MPLLSYSKKSINFFKSLFKCDSKFLRVLFEVMWYIVYMPQRTTWCTQFSFYNVGEKCTRQTNSLTLALWNAKRRGNLHACFPIPPLPIRYGLGLKVFFGRGFCVWGQFWVRWWGRWKEGVRKKAEIYLYVKRKGKCIGLILR